MESIKDYPVNFIHVCGPAYFLPVVYILHNIFFSGYSEYDIDVVPLSYLTNQALLSSIKSLLLKFRIKLGIDEWVLLVEESLSLKYLREMICGKHLCIYMRTYS